MATWDCGIAGFGADIVRYFVRRVVVPGLGMPLDFNVSLADVTKDYV